MRFASKTCLITGASGTIGDAIGTALSKDGAAVHAISRYPQPTGKYQWHNADFCDDGNLETQFAEIADKIQELDILVHSAAHYSTGLLSDTPGAELERSWKVNSKAPWMLTKAMLPALVRARGTVVFINSSIWLRASAGLGAFSSSKYALKAIADAIRDEVNEQGVRVISLFVGRVAGQLQERIAMEANKPYDPSRMIEAEELAATLLNAMALSETSEIIDLHIRSMKKPRV